MLRLLSPQTRSFQIREGIDRTVTLARRPATSILLSTGIDLDISAILWKVHRDVMGYKGDQKNADVCTFTH